LGKGEFATFLRQLLRYEGFPWQAYRKQRSVGQLTTLLSNFARYLDFLPRLLPLALPPEDKPADHSLEVRKYNGFQRIVVYCSVTTGTPSYQVPGSAD